VSQAFSPFVMAGLALIFVGLAAMAVRLIPECWAWGIMSLSQITTGLGGFVTGNTVAACISAIAAAYTAWRWWNGGGGDGTRRRLRAWVRRFRGVRRTAPAGA
jgi:hypothetical protein